MVEKSGQSSPCVPIFGIHLQALRGGTSLNGIESDFIRIFKVIFFLSQIVSFTVDSNPL